MSNPTAPVWPLQHWAGLTGRIMLKAGPHATAVTQGDLVLMLARVRRNATGIARRGGVSLDESQLVHLIDTYFAEDVAQPIDEDDAAHAEEQRRHAVIRYDQAEAI